MENKYRISVELFIDELNSIFNNPYGRLYKNKNLLPIHFEQDTRKIGNIIESHLYVYEGEERTLVVLTRTTTENEEEAYKYFYKNIISYCLLVEDSEYELLNGTKKITKSIKTLYNGK